MQTEKSLFHIKFIIGKTLRLFFALVFIVFFASYSVAQWRIATPRDALVVNADSINPAIGKFALTSGVEMWVQASNTFAELNGSTTFSIDAAYTYEVNGAPLIPQALNPPTLPSWSAVFPRGPGIPPRHTPGGLRFFSASN